VKLLLKVLFLSMILAGIVMGWSTVSAASAGNIYIAQSASGSANGSNCGNAYAYTFFNNSGNWGSGSSQIGSGTTVHVCGTWSGTAGQWFLAFQASGASGSPITLYFEPNAILQAPYFNSNGAINTRGYSYLTIDGGTNGLIQNTLNGSPGGACPGGTCSYQQASMAIQASGSSNFTLKNLTIANLYVHTSASDTAIGNSSVNCIYNNGSFTNWTISNNTMHDVSWCISIQYGNSTNAVISGNTIYNVDHAIAFGGPAPGNTLNGVTISGNKIRDYSNWDTTANAYHHDGIHIWGYNDNGSDAISNISIYDNAFGGCVGQNVTAHIFMEANGGNTRSVTIFNNTLMDTCAGNVTNGFITTGVDSGYQIYDNTAIGASTDTCYATSSSPSVVFKNNVASGCGTFMDVTTGGGFATGGLNNNVYANSGRSNVFVYHGNYTSSLSSWQSETGQDANSVYAANALLNSNGSPQIGSPVIGAGVNLTSLGVTMLDSDIVGTARPVSGAWDVGAFVYSGAPAPPTGLTATPN
jgi:hypothetical protein